MDTFSKKIRMEKSDPDKKDDVVFSNDHMKLISYKDWTIVKESDFIVCIPYLIESNQIILRYEFIPTYDYVDGQEYHVTILSGSIDKDEVPEQTVARELEEEAGIVLSPDYKIEFLKPLFVSKSHTSKYYPCILSLAENNYHEVMPKTDGSKAEKLSKSVKIDIKYLSSINTSDIITDYMVGKMREYLNLK